MSTTTSIPTTTQVYQYPATVYYGSLIQATSSAPASSISFDRRTLPTSIVTVSTNKYYIVDTVISSTSSERHTPPTSIVTVSTDKYYIVTTVDSSTSSEKQAPPTSVVTVSTNRYYIVDTVTSSDTTDTTESPASPVSPGLTTISYISDSTVSPVTYAASTATDSSNGNFLPISIITLSINRYSAVSTVLGSLTPAVSTPHDFKASSDMGNGNGITDASLLFIPVGVLLLLF
ncbi:unnamed protein product [Ambrosiozyma monospora]|uniref:Unnamed protein product n=1 Tax=Ambrosiozyma monospora TaxID=43982 RepID=A0ACB5U5X8_AMBMO|nr:unnamed protein product [Ambrosiozyma monospora]